MPVIRSRGYNPALAISELVVYLEKVLEQKSKGMVLATIVNIAVGSKDFGVSAGTGEVSITLRAEYEEEMNALEEKVRAKAAELHIPLIEMKEMWRASEDFGYYTARCPGAIFYLGNGTDYPPLHTPAYDFNDHILETAVDMFLALGA